VPYCLSATSQNQFAFSPHPPSKYLLPGLNMVLAISSGNPSLKRLAKEPNSNSEQTAVNIHSEVCTLIVKSFQFGVIVVLRTSMKKIIQK
jgi:hypothetical protein